MEKVKGSEYFPNVLGDDRIQLRQHNQQKQSCRMLDLYIVNGMLWGASYGRYTNNSSLVDYSITDLNPESLRMFTVSPLTPLLDHSKITAYLNRAILNHEASKLNKLHTTEKRYRRKESSSETYQQQIQSLLDNFLDKTFHWRCKLYIWPFNFPIKS